MRTPPLTPFLPRTSKTYFDSTEFSPQKSLSDVRFGELYLTHEVTMSDTLPGLCLRYRTTARELRALNNFPGEHFKILCRLVVPKRQLNKGTPEINCFDERCFYLKGEGHEMNEKQNPKTSITQLVLVKNLSRETGISERRAINHLESCEWNYDKAISRCNTTIVKSLQLLAIPILTNSDAKQSKYDMLLYRISAFLSTKCKSVRRKDLGIELQDICTSTF